MGNSKTKPESNKIGSNATTSTDTVRSNSSLYPQLQVRNCVRDPQNNTDSSFGGMFENVVTNGEPNRPIGFTVGVHPTDTLHNYTNGNDVQKKPVAQDGLPSYEEAVAGFCAPNVTNAPTTIVQPTQEQSSNTSERGHRHRRHHKRHHRNRHHSADQSEDQSQPPSEEHHRGRRHRRHRKGRHDRNENCCPESDDRRRNNTD